MLELTTVLIRLPEFCTAESSCLPFVQHPLPLPIDASHRVYDRLPPLPTSPHHLYSLDLYPCSSSREIVRCMIVRLLPNLILSSFTPAPRINVTLFDRVSPSILRCFSLFWLARFCFLLSVSTTLVPCVSRPNFSCSCVSRSLLRLRSMVFSLSIHPFPLIRFLCVMSGDPHPGVRHLCAQMYCTVP